MYAVICKRCRVFKISRNTHTISKPTFYNDITFDIGLFVGNQGSNVCLSIFTHMTFRFWFSIYLSQLKLRLYNHIFKPWFPTTNPMSSKTVLENLYTICTNPFHYFWTNPAISKSKSPVLSSYGVCTAAFQKFWRKIIREWEREIVLKSQTLL